MSDQTCPGDERLQAVNRFRTRFPKLHFTVDLPQGQDGTWHVDVLNEYDRVVGLIKLVSPETDAWIGVSEASRADLQDLSEEWLVDADAAIGWIAKHLVARAKPADPGLFSA